MRIDTQKQTLTARDESIKKLLEMLQNKGEGKKKICSAAVKRVVGAHTKNIEEEVKLMFVFLSSGKEEEARVHQHMQMVAQKQVGPFITRDKTDISAGLI